MTTLFASLRQTAQAALDVDPGPWRYDGRDIFTDSRGGFADHTLILPLPETWHESQAVPDAIADHVAACDPSTILALVEAAERARYLAVPYVVDAADRGDAEAEGDLAQLRVAFDKLERAE